MCFFYNVIEYYQQVCVPAVVGLPETCIITKTDFLLNTSNMKVPQIINYFQFC